ncbi:hypothetical protein BKA70DRAFT_1411422 [Coprinopsis sp. MPI-PUGE-AT-0042]|nr:hypothetical protein BKA70DRAFT_1411422 [Coprinopsis sp. MPI-PUGE-AT-0042]
MTTAVTFEYTLDDFRFGRFLKGLFVSLQGNFHQSFLIQFIQSFSYRYQIFLDIEKEEDKDETPFSQISFCIMDRPPQLEHYLATNDILPVNDLPTLQDYLAQLSERIASLERDGAWLHAHEIVAQAERDRLQREYKLCVNIKNPVRKIPQEILGVIFAFAVGTGPASRFIDIAHLRGVCSSWRNAALSTPGLWTNLTVDLDTWFPLEPHGLDEPVLLHPFEDSLKPWLAILSRNPAYHLTVTSSDPRASISNTSEDHRIHLVQYLLSTTPQPGTITLKSPAGPHAITSLAFMGITCSALELKVSGIWTADLRAVGSVFPKLESFEIRIPWTLSPIPPLQHTSLRTLSLQDLEGQGVYIHHLIHDLPGLCELKLSSDNFMKRGNEFEVPPVAYTHHSLETLVLNGEDFLLALRHISLPSLRFLAVRGHQFEAYPNEVLNNIFTNATQPLLIMLHGQFYPTFISLLIQSRPPKCHFLFGLEFAVDEGLGLTVSLASNNVEAVFCGPGNVELRWLSPAEPVRNRVARPVPIYLPIGFKDWEKGYSRQDELRQHGFELEPLSNESVGSMLRSLAPPFSKYSAGWWECERVMDFSLYTEHR